MSNIESKSFRDLSKIKMNRAVFKSEIYLCDSAWSRVKEGFRNLPVRRTRSSNTKVTTEFLKIKIGIQILRNM